VSDVNVKPSRLMFAVLSVEIKDVCFEKKSNKSQFVKKQQTGGDFSSMLNTVTSGIKLPWTKFKGEMHIPGMNFAGPGTNLNKLLTPTGQYHDWSKPDWSKPVE